MFQCNYVNRLCIRLKLKGAESVVFYPEYCWLEPSEV